MKSTVPCLWVMLLAGSLCFLCGCGGTHNPSYFPHLVPFGDIIPTHAKPTGPSYFQNFDPHAIRLEVRPLEATNPVRTQHVLIATVYDEYGRPRRQRRVEWMLEGVGNIVEVDESGVFPGRGYKTSSKHAVSYTDYHEHRITRGNNDPKDDFVIRPGQTWCVISSSVEGDSHVTAYAPGVANWEKGRVFVVCHWVDAHWVFPPPGAARAGSEHVLTTKIFRHTDQKSLANYRVRYTIQDGPEAVFIPNRTKEAVAVSDYSGNAHAGLVQLAPVQGVNRIGIEIIRPPDPTAPSGTGIVIAKGETTVEWQAPAVALSHSGPPALGLGQEVTFTTTINNAGKVESRSMTVNSVIPDGLQYLRSQPPAFSADKQLTWALGTLPPGQAHTIQTIYKALRPGPVTSCAAVLTEEGFKDEKCFTSQVTTPGLKVSITAPATGTMNTPINYQITITNTGSGPVANVQLTAQFDAGLEHETKANPVTLNRERLAGLASLGPQESQVVGLVLTPRQAGRLNTRITVLADGGLSDVAEHAVVVPQAAQGQLSLSIDGPKTRYVGRPAEFTLRVSNSGEAALTNVIVHDQLPAELAFVSAGQGGKLAGNEVVWNVGNLQAKEQRLLQVTMNPQKIAAAAVQNVLATADPAARAQAQGSLEILGIPAFRLEVGDIGYDPVEIGKRLTYQIKVTNTGSLPANQVEIKALVPNEMKVVEAKGPSKVNVAGQAITFDKLDGVEPGKTLVYTVEVEGVKAGDVRFRVELRGQTLQTPVIEEEGSRIFAPGQPPKL